MVNMGELVKHLKNNPKANYMLHVYNLYACYSHDVVFKPHLTCKW